MSSRPRNSHFQNYGRVDREITDAEISTWSTWLTAVLCSANVPC